jgi:hypothetical protein
MFNSAMLLGAAFSVRRLRRAQAVRLPLRDAGELPMFAGIVAAKRNNAGKADVGEGETGAEAISATSNVS